MRSSQEALAISTITKIRFPARAGFHATVKARVDQYFADKHLAKTGDWRLFVKTGLIFSWILVSYVFLTFFSTSLLTTVLGVLALAHGLALAACNIAHDGAHDSYSQNKTLSWLMGCTLDLLGGSQMLWRQKHNRFHHIYTNIHGADDDIDGHFILRLSPHQPWHPWHRLQHIYAFAMYSLLTLSWVVFSDMKKLVTGRLGRHALRKPTGTELGFFLGAKLFYFGYTLVLPLAFHPWQHVLMAFVGVHLVLGFTLSMAFQLAHTIEQTRFPLPDPDTGMMPETWARHAVETTVNFAPRNPWATWYLGGLNFQIEHHLFANICHRHYPAISPIVAQTCQEFAIPYVSYPTVRSAIAGHYRFLKTLGRGITPGVSCAPR